MGGVKTGMMAGALALAAFGTAAAQAPAGGESARAQQIQARFQILAMEGVLERAVQLGAQRVRAQVQALAPDMLFITGAARARGFWLDGYGVFFDVDVPAMRRSLAWSFRVLEQSDRGLELTLTALKRQIAAVDDAAARRDLQQTLAAARSARRPRRHRRARRARRAERLASRSGSCGCCFPAGGRGQDRARGSG